MILAALLLGWNIFFSSQVIQLNVCSPQSQTIIVAPADGTATFSSAILVSGTADNNSSVTVKDNGVTVASLSADASGNFQVLIPLRLGTNQLLAESRDTCSNLSTSPTVTVTRLSVTPVPVKSAPKATTEQPLSPGTVTPVPTVPELVLTLEFSGVPLAAFTPSGFVMTEKAVFVSGRATADGKIYVANNGNQVAQITAASDGQFGVSIPLGYGRNSIAFRLEAGEKTLTRTLTYVRVHTSVAQPWYENKQLWASVVAGTATFTALTVYVVRLRRRKIGL